MNLMLFTMP